MRHLTILLACIVATQFAAAQTSMGSGMPGMTSGSGGTADTGQSSSGSQARNPADDITAVAPPFDVEDVIRMHRVGLQSEVIINALRARYHPLALSNDDKALLRRNHVGEDVIAAMENPWAVPPTTPSAIPEKAPGPNPAPPVAPTYMPYAAPSLPATESANSRTRMTGPPATFHSFDPRADALIGDQPLPTELGIYRRLQSGGWQRLSEEQVTWSHDSEQPSKAVAGTLRGPVSLTMTRAIDRDFLVVAPENISIVQYQLLRLRADSRKRIFTPTVGGDAFGGAANQAVVPYSPLRISPTIWLVSLGNLRSGDYGFLSPQNSVLHSATGFDNKVFTFHVL